MKLPPKKERQAQEINHVGLIKVSRKTLPIVLMMLGGMLLLIAIMLINIETAADIQSKLLNRLGILLGLLGSFMIAPDLIGLDRIRKIEKGIKNNYQSIERKILTTQKRLINSPTVPFFAVWGLAIGVVIGVTIIINKNSVLSYLRNPSTIPLHFRTMLIVLSVYLIVVTIILVTILIGSSKSRSTNVPSYIERRPSPKADSSRLVFYIIPNHQTIIISIIALVTSLLVVSPVLIILGSLYLFLLIFHQSLTSLRKSLENQESLSGILKRIGIFNVILGALFQLIATM